MKIYCAAIGYGWEGEFISGIWRKTEESAILDFPELLTRLQSEEYHYYDFKVDPFKPSILEDELED